MKNIWQELKQLNRPIRILAPMEDVTDTVFRQVVLKVGRPDIFFTEFMSCEGFVSKQGKSKVSHRLQFLKIEKPLIAQIWGTKPESFLQTAKELVEMDFDGIDINMGCPQKHIIKGGGCAALIKDPTLAKEIVLATKEGLKGQIPLSVKTRIGFNNIETEQWIAHLLKLNIDALIVHGRTAKEMSKSIANWDEIKKAVEIRNSISPNTILIGNGDVTSIEDGNSKTNYAHADGFMVGRGIFQNLWLFNESINPSNISKAERIKMLNFHIELFEKTWKGIKPKHILNHYFKIYLQGFDGAAKMREELMKN